MDYGPKPRSRGPVWTPITPVAGSLLRADQQLKTTLKAEIDEEAWDSLYSDTSRPFPKPKSGRIAVKVINHLGDEVMKVFAVE